MAKTSNHRGSIEALVTQAYLKLVNVSWDQNGSRSISIARYGSYEVRLIELLPVANNDCPFLWIDLHDHGNQVTLDSTGCDDFESAIGAVEEATAHAKRLAGEGGGSLT